MSASVSIQPLRDLPMDLHAVGVTAGYLGAALGVGMVVPQVVRTLRNRHLPGVSALSWSLTALSCLTWLLYGLRTGEMPQVPGNVLIVGGALAIVLLVPSRVPRRNRALLLVAALVPIAAAAVLAPPTDLGLLAFGIGLTSSWPQLLTSFARPAGTPSAVSVSAWLMRCASQLSWLLYALVLHDVAVTISASVLLAGAVVVLAVEQRHRSAPAAGVLMAPAEPCVSTR